jgi:hypothetical protein
MTWVSSVRKVARSASSVSIEARALPRLVHMIQSARKFETQVSCHCSTLESCERIAALIFTEGNRSKMIIQDLTPHFAAGAGRFSSIRPAPGPFVSYGLAWMVSEELLVRGCGLPFTAVALMLDVNVFVPVGTPLVLSYLL